MRWRYLILGLFVAVPTGTVIHFWPQRPAYGIPGGRQYLADDPAQRQLLFLDDKRKAGLPPVIERYDADSGRLVSSVQLHSESNDPRSLMNGVVVISGDLKTICLFNWAVDEDGQHFKLTAFFFDVESGNRRAGEVSLANHVCKGLAHNGKWFAGINNLTNLVVIDTQSYRIHAEVRCPTGHYVNMSICFSPDNKQLLYQWRLVGEVGRVLHLLDLETGQEVRTFSVPKDQWLCEWKPGELRISEPLSQHGDNWPVRRYRHPFDGITLGPGTSDPLLDTSDRMLSVANLLVDTESWVGQFESHQQRQPRWVKMLDLLESKTDWNLVDHRRVLWYCGTVRLIDRATKSVRFEKEVPHADRCHFALDGKLLIVDTEPSTFRLNAGFGLGLFTATQAPTFTFTSTTSVPAPGLPPPPQPFEIYRTDPWPRWLWTALGALAVITAFALIARWRHVTIRRRLAVST
jgi:hypothetical protein